MCQVMSQLGLTRWLTFIGRINRGDEAIGRAQ